MEIETAQVEKILRQGKYLKDEILAKALEDASKANKPLKNFLLENRLLTSDILGQAVAEFYKLKYYDLNSKPAKADIVTQLPEDICRKYKMVLVDDTEGAVLVATSEADKAKDILQKLKELFPNEKFLITYSLDEDINDTLKFFDAPLQDTLDKLSKDKHADIPKILDEIVQEAIQKQASDIHMEPERKIVKVRFRLDGVLTEIANLDKKIYLNILNKIKVEANMRIDEHNKTQDGAIRLNSGDVEIDFRISIIPIIDGEKVVMRVLSQYVKNFGLGELGLDEAGQKHLEESYKKPFGMILAVGPTGSGKTTTLYSTIKILNTPGVNITTIEDPVEYRIKGVNQIQVNTNADITFSKGLRSIVRQDPNIILVGEIRDHETAEIAVNAALTGHLLLSTFHANDAATTIPRLLDMGIEPFLLASTLNLIMAQRLVRKICEHCRLSYTPKATELNALAKGLDKALPKKDLTLYKGKGCDICNNSGFKGRTAIFENIPITPEIQDLILKKPSSNEVYKLARSQGMKTFFEDGINKVLSGITSIEELLRVAPFKNDN